MSRIAKILAMVLLLSPVTGLPARAAEVNLDPADPVVAVGDTISVSITISLDETAGEQLAGGVIDLGYNDGVVEIIAVAIDPYLDFEPDPGSKTGPGLWEGIGFDVFENDPVNENTLIASVTLEALAAGISQLAVLPSSRFFSATAEIFPTVTNASIRVNTPPAANDDSYATDEETTLVVDAPGVLANDADLENDPLSAVLDASPANGTLTLDPDGSFTYTPNDNFAGPDSFTYHADDNQHDSGIATVSIVVGAVNDPPAANNDSYVTDEDATLDIASPGVLSNDADVESSTLTAALDAGPSNGTLTLNSDGSFTYTPNANFNGIDSFTYKANDGLLDSNIATVTITVNAINDAPVADPNGPYSGTEGSPVSFDGTGSSDAGGTIVSYAWDFGDTTTGTGASPTHTYAAAGLYTVTLTVTDNGGLTHTAGTTADIQVPPNRPPVADAGPDQTILIGDTVTLDGSWSYDDDGDALNCRWSFISKPTHSTATLDTTDPFYPTFVVDVEGTYVVQLVVNDGTVDSAPDTVRIRTQNPALPSIYLLLLN